jgi:septum site-determining protein MinC
MARERVSIKGTSNGVIITIGPGDWQTILKELALKLGQKSSFFKGGRVALSVGKRVLNAEEIEVVGELLVKHQMSLWAVNSEAPETRTAAESLGLEFELTVATPAPPVSPGEMRPLIDTTMIIRRTLRSGQRVEHPGNVVIIGDVNPGAEVVAGGYVIIWGRLRGTVHAGAVKAEDTFVCALELLPMQLIIGNVISRSPTDDSPAEIIPEMAFVQDGQIVAEAWR